MANNKKVFSIEINGITESVRSIDALTEKIKKLQKLINSIGKIEIPVEIGGDIEKLTKQLNQVKTKIAKTTTNKQQVKDEQELVKALEQRKKALQAVNKELGTTGKNSDEFKSETKALVAEAIKARNEAEGYANTLNGLKKELKDLNSIKGDIDLGSKEYSEISQRIYEITQRLKEYEAAMGSHGRNVGNYTEGILDASKQMDEFSKKAKETGENVDEIRKKFEKVKGVELNAENVKKYGISISDLKWQIQTLEKELDGLTIGSDEWNATNQALLNLKQTLGTVQRDMEAAVRAEDQLNTKIKVNINGMNLVFDDVNQAVGVLEDKMYALASAGKRDTKEFQDMAKAASDLKIQVKAVDTQIDAITEGGGGINKMLSYAQGFSAIATASQGLTQLFGNDENSAKGVQTMTALIGVMESLRVVSQEMQQGTKFGKMLEDWLHKFQALTAGLESYKKSYTSMMDAMVKGDAKNIDFIDTSKINQTIALVSGLRTEYSSLHKTLSDLAGEEIPHGIANLSEALERLNGEGKISNDLYDELGKRIVNLDETAFELSGDTIKLSDAFGTFKGNIALLGQSLKKFIVGLGQGIKNIFTWKNATIQASEGTVQMSRGLVLATKGMRGLTVAAKALSMALKATIIFAIIEFLMQLVGWLTDAVKWVYEFATGNDKLVDSLTTVQSRLDVTTRSVSKFITEVERLKDSGKLDNLEADALILEKLENELKKSILGLKKFIQIREEMKSLEESSKDDDYTLFGIASDIDGIDDATERLKAFEKAYKQLLDAVESGTDESAAIDGSWLRSLWTTKKDAKADLGEMQKKVIDDIQYKINNLDLSKGEEELKKFFKLMDTEMYATSLANIENLYPEEEWAKVLKERLDAVREMYEQMDEVSARSGIEQLKNFNDVSKQIRDNNTEAIKDSYQRERKQLENQREDEIKAAKGNQELILSIEAKYSRLRQDLLDQHNKDLKAKSEKAASDAKKAEEDKYNALKAIRDNQLAIEAESLAKRIKTLENAKQDEIRDAEKNGIMVNELKLSIEKKYDKLIQKEKENHLKYLNDLSEEYARKEIELRQALKASELDNEGKRIDINYEVSTFQGSYDFDAQYGDKIKAEKEFAKQRLEIELKYLQDKKKLDEDNANLDFDNEIIAEKQRYQDRLNELQSFLDEGKLDNQEYNTFVERETELHSSKLQSIETQRTNELKNINDKYLNDVKTETSKSLTSTANMYSEYQRKVSDIMSKVGTDKNIFGVTDFGATKQKLQIAYATVQEGIGKIDEEMADLEEKHKSGQIGILDYKQAKESLQETKKALNEEGEDIKENMKGLITDIASEWKGVIDQFVGMISSFLQTINETKLQLIDNEIAEVEHQLEIQQEAYDKAEAAAEAHKEKMDSIEDELADARGSRRQFLIDTLAAQQSAYLEELDAQQDAEKQKEKLEKKQEALEKRRKEQEKKSKVQQAIINTYTAVSNALAVQPWFLGLALSAVALGLGLRNVMAIKSTPIYEDGGVIQGARHSQGGVKVLGGQAEVEGGEFITNRKSTAANLPLLHYINDKKKTLTAEDLLEFFSNGTPRMRSKATNKFASGGQLPTTNGAEVTRVVNVADIAEDNTTYVVSVVDVINATENLKKVQVLSGLVDK